MKTRGGDISQGSIFVGRFDHEIGGFFGVLAVAEGLDHGDARLGVPNGLHDLVLGFVHHDFRLVPLALGALDLPADGIALLDFAGAFRTTILRKISVA